MDNYPIELAPQKISNFENELFELWFNRVGYKFNAPCEVAQHWIWQHWGHSPYGWIPSNAVSFVKESWALQKILSTTSEYGSAEEHAAHGKHLLEIDEKDGGFLIAAEMKKSRTYWPAPAIILDQTENHSFESSLLDDMGKLHLIEGHQRTAILRALAKQVITLEHHDVWVMRFI